MSNKNFLIKNGLSIGADNEVISSARAGSFTAATITGDLTVDGSTLKVDSSNNRVGIGTTSPATALHVNTTAAESVGTFDCTQRYCQVDWKKSGVQKGAIWTDNTDENFTMYTPSGWDIDFWAGAVRRLRIDSNGTVQIGSTTTYAAGASVLHLHQPDATSNAYLHITQEDGGSTSSDGMSIGVLDGGTNAVIRLRENGFLATYTNNTERMRIDRFGRVGIGSDGPSTMLHIRGAQNDTYGQLYIRGGTADNQDPQIAMGSNANGRGFYLDDSAVNRFKIYTGHGKGASSGAYEFSLDNSGTIESPRTYANTTGSYSANVYVHSDGSFNRATSSRRYKKDIVDATKGLDEILQLKPRNYKPKNDRTDSTELNAEINDPHLDAEERIFAGLIAEEVHDLGLTEYVDYEEDGTTPTGLYYGNMVALLVKGIQEQQTTINDLKARIETLEG